MYNDWCKNPYFDTCTQNEVRGLNQDEIEDRFSCDLHFGTGGLRGKMGAGTNRLNVYTVRRIAYGLVEYILCTNNATASAVIAFDTRNNSAVFAKEIAAVFSAKGITVQLFGAPVPTPVLSFATWRMHAAAGIMVTASHNPKEYNGIKVYDGDGVQLVPGKAADAIRFIEAVASYPPAVQPMQEHILQISDVLLNEFLLRVRAQSRDQVQHPELKIVYTPLHGAGMRPVTEILRMDGFTDVTLVPAQCEQNGNFPSVSVPNPEDPHALEMAMQLGLLSGSDIVLGTDADSDRLGVGILHEGEYRLLSGNQIGALLLHFLLETAPQNEAAGNTLLTTVASSAFAKKIARENGLHVIETPVGFKYIGEQIVSLTLTQQYRFLIAYEESYGFLVGTHARDKDAVVAAMLICEAAAYWKARGKTLCDVLSSLYAKYGYYLDALETFQMEGSAGTRSIAEIMRSLRATGTGVFPDCMQITDYLQGCNSFPAENMLKWKLLDGSWAIARPSGTEPKIKFYFSVCGVNASTAKERLLSIQRGLYACWKQ